MSRSYYCLLTLPSYGGSSTSTIFRNGHATYLSYGNYDFRRLDMIDIYKKTDRLLGQ